MAEEKEEAAAEEKKKGPPLIVFIAGGMVLLSVVAFVVVRFVFAPKAEEADVEEVVEEKKVEAPAYGPLFSFDQAIVVNLAETNGQRYLKVNVQLEMNEEILAEELTARVPQLLDLVITILSSKTIEDVSTTVGRNRLKREVIDRINAELVTGKIINIFFTEFVIQ